MLGFILGKRLSEWLDGTAECLCAGMPSGNSDVNRDDMNQMNNMMGQMNGMVNMMSQMSGMTGVSDARSTAESLFSEDTSNVKK